MAGLDIMLADTAVDTWDWDEMRSSDLYDLVPHTWFIHGKTRTGKTYFVREMLYHLRHVFAYGWCFRYARARAYCSLTLAQSH